MTLPGENAPSDGARFDQSSGLSVALQLLSHKWTPLILWLLKTGPKRFGELRAGLVEIRPQVLSQSLRGMERDGLVVRRDHHERPPRVDYHLTELGHSLCLPAEYLADWADEHIGGVHAARMRYDAADPSIRG